MYMCKQVCVEGRGEKKEGSFVLVKDEEGEICLYVHLIEFLCVFACVHVEERGSKKQGSFVSIKDGEEATYPHMFDRRNIYLYVIDGVCVYVYGCV